MLHPSLEIQHVTMASALALLTEAELCHYEGKTEFVL